MGNKISSSNNKIYEGHEFIKEIQTEEHLSHVKYDKEIQTDDISPVNCDKEIQSQADIQVDTPSQIESVRICIVLPNCTYKWDGILEEAPHIIHKMPEIDWAKHMDKMISDRRKSCHWLKEHNRKRQICIDNDRNGRSGHYDYRARELWLSYTWEIEPTMPPCGAKDIQHNQLCPGSNKQIKQLIIMEKLNKNPKFDGFLFNTKRCSGFCYYKHIIEVEIHNLSCKVCSVSALMRR